MKNNVPTFIIFGNLTSLKNHPLAYVTFIFSSIFFVESSFRSALIFIVSVGNDYNVYRDYIHENDVKLKV